MLGIKNMNISIAGLIVIAIASALFCSHIGMSAELSLDGHVIKHLKKAGSNINKHHDIEFFFYFPTLEAAERIAAQLRSEGFVAIAEQAPKRNDFIVQATKLMIPNDAELTALRQRFDAMSATEKGEYDGWGSLVVK